MHQNFARIMSRMSSVGAARQNKKANQICFDEVENSQSQLAL